MQKNTTDWRLRLVCAAPPDLSHEPSGTGPHASGEKSASSLLSARADVLRPRFYIKRCGEKGAIQFVQFACFFRPGTRHNAGKKRRESNIKNKKMKYVQRCVLCALLAWGRYIPPDWRCPARVSVSPLHEPRTHYRMEWDLIPMRGAKKWTNGQARCVPQKEHVNLAIVLHALVLCSLNVLGIYISPVPHDGVKYLLRRAPGLG